MTWTFFVCICNIKGMETKVYILDLKEFENKERFDELYALMPEYRREKIDRIKSEADKIRSLGAGVLLHNLCKEFGMEGADNNILIGENGKPSFREYRDIHFSLSHSGERAMLVASDRECGCDVEKIKPINMNIAKRSFDSTEYEYIMEAISEEEKAERFFRLWTMKESVMKVTGQGFKLFPNTFSIDLSKEKPILSSGNGLDKIELFDMIKNDGYVYAYGIETVPVP